MSTIRIAYYGLIRNIVGGREEQVELAEGATVGELIDALVTRHGKCFREQLVAESGKVRRNARVFVNDREISPVGGLGAYLGAGDDVTFVVAVSQMSGG